MSNNSYDTIIIGGGISGLACARKLASYGEDFLLIIDESHYLRNPESMTSNLGRLLRDVSEHVLLLSATPIHLKNRDLYQLLNLVDENTFNQPQVFDEILEANAPILRARDAVLHEEIGQEQFISLIEEARKKVIWMMCTTELKVIPKTIFTRCQVYKLKPIKREKIEERLRNGRENP